MKVMRIIVLTEFAMRRIVDVFELLRGTSLAYNGLALEIVYMNFVSQCPQEIT